MPRPRLAMRKVRDILRLAWGQGLSRRQVGASLGIPLTTVADHLRRAAELLVAHLLGTTRSGVYGRLDAAVDGALEPLLARREQREPLAYVLGEWGFRRLVLKTDRRALVPRPETEVVVDRCLELLRDLPEPRPRLTSPHRPPAPSKPARRGSDGHRPARLQIR